MVMDQPAADACAAVGVFAWRLEGALQHVSTHTAQKTIIHVANKPVKIIAHPAPTQISERKTLKRRQPCNCVLLFIQIFCLFTCSDSYLTSNFHSIQLFFLLPVFTLLAAAQVTFPLISSSLQPFLRHLLLTCCSIKVRVPSHLKPSPRFESPWRGIPDNKGSGHRQTAVRRDQIRETDRITGKNTQTSVFGSVYSSLPYQ